MPVAFALAMAVGVVGPVAAQDPNAEPRYGATSLIGGFDPDPYGVDVVAGGPDRAEHLGEGCIGFISNEKPDYSLTFSPADYRLGLFVEGAADTTLIVNDPLGQWHCNNDFSSEGGGNPGLVFDEPRAGRYDIWVGAYDASGNDVRVRLVITERGAPWAVAPVASNVEFGDDASRYARDGECDDPRFTGDGMATRLLDADRFHDAADCRALFDQGRIALAPADAAPSAPAAAPGTTLVASGTGFFVGDSGHVLTNNHVIEGCVRTTVQVVGEPAVEAAALSSNEDADLALLKAPVQPRASAAFRGSRSVRQGEEVVVYGFPLHGELSSQGNLTSGLVAALSGFFDDLRVMQVSAPIQPGNSGGPVMDRSGSIVGVIVAAADSQTFMQEGRALPQNINFAIRDSLARAFLETNSVDYKIASSAPVLSVADIAERAQDFTVLILCYQ